MGDVTINGIEQQEEEYEECSSGEVIRREGWDRGSQREEWRWVG